MYDRDLRFLSEEIFVTGWESVSLRSKFLCNTTIRKMPPQPKKKSSTAANTASKNASSAKKTGAGSSSASSAANGSTKDPLLAPDLAFPDLAFTPDRRGAVAQLLGRNSASSSSSFGRGGAQDPLGAALCEM